MTDSDYEKTLGDLRTSLDVWIERLIKNARQIFKEKIESKEFPIYKFAKKIKFITLIEQEANDLCALFECEAKVKKWQDDMSNFSIDQLKFKASEEFKNKLISKFDPVLLCEKPEVGDFLEEVLSKEFTKTIAIIQKLVQLKIEITSPSLGLAPKLSSTITTKNNIAKQYWDDVNIMKNNDATWKIT